MRVLSPPQVVSILYILGDILDIELSVLDRVARNYSDHELREIAFEWFRELDQAGKRHVLTLVTQRHH